MRLISRPSCWFDKMAVPTFCLVFIALAVFQMITAGYAIWLSLLLGACSAAVLYLLFRRLVLPMLGEVWIDGDDLVVRNYGQEDRFPIANVVDLKASVGVSPEDIWLTVNPPSRFGQKIHFVPPHRWLLIGYHSVVQELIERSRCNERQGTDAPQ